MRDHWTKFLPEFGRCYLVDSIESAQARAKHARQQAEQYDRQADELETDLLPLIRAQYTTRQIAEAKRDAETFNTVAERTQHQTT